MKKVYFVRHGESEGNAGDFMQDSLTPLSPKGKDQADFIAKRLSSFPIDLVVSSSMKRAKDTAEIINRQFSKMHIFSDLFVERRRPSVVSGKKKDDPFTIEVTETVFNNFRTPGFRHSDEENFEDLKERAGKALQFLDNLEEHEIVVVSHGLFLRVMLSYILFGKDLSAGECDEILWKMNTFNTGLFIVHKDDRYHFGRFSLGTTTPI